MQNTKIGARLISFVLTLATLLSVFSVFAFAAESTGGVSDSELSVAFNRTFSEGWDYTNGIVDALAKGNTAGLANEYRNSAYNYYLRLDKQNTKVSYLYIDTEGRLATSGKTFIELDITSGGDCAMGQAIRVSVKGDIRTLVEFEEDGMYVLGQNIGTSVYALKWESLAFEFDFDYASEETLNTCYKVSAYHDGSLIASEAWEYGMYGAGISQVRFAFGDIQEQNVGAWYGVDNVKIYSGVDEFTNLDSEDYGLAVDTTLPKTVNIAGGIADPDGYLRGTPDVERLDTVGTALIHYNRHFGEGWDLTNGGEINDGGNNVDIRSEKNAYGEYNYFYRFRALGTKNGYLQIPVKSYPQDEALYLELDLKAGVNTNLGGILQVRSSDDKSMYALSIKDGQLVIFDTPVGYIGSDWTHLILVFNNERDDYGKFACTVYYGERGVMKCSYDIGTVSGFRLGAAGGGDEDKYGDWFGVDNLQIYSGTKYFVTLPEDDHGLGVDSTLAPNFKLEDAGKEEEPLDPDGGTSGGTGDFTVDVQKDRILKGSREFDRVDYVEGETWLRYNRHYGEGWDFAVGGGSSNAAIMQLQAEQRLDLTYNYYQYYEQSMGSKNAYWNFSMGASYPRTGSMFMEFDLKAVEGCNVEGIIQMRQASGSGNSYLFALEQGYLVTYASGSSTGVKLGKLTEDEWAHVAVQFDFDYANNNPETANPEHYLIRIWVGDQTYYEAKHSRNGSVFGITSFRVGFEGSPAANDGQFWCMDNMQVYGGTDTFCNIPADKYGEAINANQEKDFPIQTTAVSLDTMIDESLFMKIGSEYGLVNYERTPNLVDENGKPVGCPTLIDDVLWIPLDTVLNFLTYPIYIHEDGMSFDISTGSQITYITLGRNTAVVGGNKVDLVAAPAMVTDKLGYEFLAVTIDDLAILFPEFHVNRDDMNMIVFSKHDQIASNGIAESIRIDIMKKFIFEYLEGDEFYERAAEYTNNFDHPYLIVNQERFDELAAVWRAGQLALDDDPTNDVEYDATHYRYINAIVNSGIAKYNSFGASVKGMVVNDGTPYEGLNPVCYIFDTEASSIGLQHPYTTSAGYDPIGGRLNEVRYEPLEPLAYAYHITGDYRFAQMAFDIANELADWNHWGPGHFLNAADAAASVAVCYDWMYDAWTELGLDVDKIADAVFYHGALQGYLVTIGSPDPHGRASGSASNYTTMVNNWNPVCTAGMAAAAFAVMDYKGFSTETKLAQTKASYRAETYGGEMVREVCTYLLSANYKSLTNIALDIYAPDGSYEESVSYWGYGANNLFRYAQLLESTIGDDLGIMDTWGIDRTCYSIMHMVSSDFLSFTYNDTTSHQIAKSTGKMSGGTGCSSGEFNYVAQSVGDDFIRLVRQMHLNDGGFSISMTDSLFYKPIEVSDDLDMPLQYHHVGIHGYTVRSSWDTGSIFAGLLGGDNDDGHGHIDAGQWVYYYGRIPFIDDMGSDGYNTYNYFSNNHMYRTTVEGHNCIMVGSDPAKLPAGQLRNSVSPVTKTYDNEHGSYVVVDTLPAYGDTLLTSERGMLFTNDRSTVIIQDEIVPNGSQTVYWLAHYCTDHIASVELTNGGRTAWLTARKKDAEAKPVVLRINMVSKMPNIQFKIMTAYDHLLPATMPPDGPGSSQSYGKNKESDRSNWGKLVVEFKNLMTINFAVAVEIVNPSDPIATGYKWTEMYKWEPYADTRTATNDDVIVDEPTTNRTTANPSDLIGYTSRLQKLFDAGTQYENLAEFYAAITQITFTVDKRGREYFSGNDRFAAALATYDNYRSIYSAYYDDVTKTTKAVFAITDLLTAHRLKADTEDAG